MTVKELIEELKKYDGDKEVVVEYYCDTGFLVDEYITKVKYETDEDVVLTIY